MPASVSRAAGASPRWRQAGLPDHRAGLPPAAVSVRGR
ncbi:hypothetical protein HDA31_002839 [Micromonospora carbonacea subsp. aurantiaca]|nr:hypothetical protein [Micromonospora carbonacea]